MIISKPNCKWFYNLIVEYYCMLEVRDEVSFTCQTQIDELLTSGSQLAHEYFNGDH